AASEYSVVLSKQVVETVVATATNELSQYRLTNKPVKDDYLVVSVDGRVLKRGNDLTAAETDYVIEAGEGNAPPLVKFATPQVGTVKFEYPVTTKILFKDAQTGTITVTYVVRPPASFSIGIDPNLQPNDGNDLSPGTDDGLRGIPFTQLFTTGLSKTVT